MSRWYERQFGYPPYVSVAERKKMAEKELARRKKSGASMTPVRIAGNRLADTFWGKAWCSNLESYRDYENRLPRGRSYVRNGAVIDLQIGPGEVDALVVGTACYRVAIRIAKLLPKRWQAIRHKCSGEIGSLLELLQGKLSDHVMAVITDHREGLFPSPAEIQFKCSCPDWAYMCKHVAATMYGIGARLDQAPELFFTLRKVDHRQLVTTLDPTQLMGKKSGRKTLVESELSDVFGIEIETSPAPQPPTRPTRPSGKKFAKSVPARRVKRRAGSRSQKSPRTPAPGTAQSPVKKPKKSSPKKPLKPARRR